MSDFVDDFEVDASDFDSSDTEGRGGLVDKAGFYHVVVNDLTLFEEEGKAKNVRVDMQVLNGTDQTQIGKMIFHRVYLNRKDGDALTKGSKAITTRLFIGFGLLPKDAAEAETVKWPFSQLKGAQAVVEIKPETYEDRNGDERTDFRIPFGNVYRFEDEKVADVPVDREALELAGAAAGDVDTSDL